MFDLIVYNLSTSLHLMASFLIFIFIIGCILYLYTRKFKVNGKRVKVYGLLFSTKNKSIIILSTMIIRTFLIIYSIIFFHQNVYYYLVMIGIISTLMIVVYFKNVIYEILNTVGLMTIVYFNYQLSSYLVNVEKTTEIISLKVILMSFGILYTIYLFLREFEEITSKHENINWGGKFKSGKYSK